MSAADDAAKRREEAGEKVRALPWKPVHETKLEKSGAKLTDMPGFFSVTGDDARTFRSLVQGTIDDSIEGEALRKSGSSEIILSWHPEGYVDAKDFASIDADELIGSVRSATFAANAEGERAGLRPITSVEWLRKPTWNDSLHTAYWMMQGVHDDGSKTVNAIALKLGRNGYEKLVWVTEPDQIEKANDLMLAQDAHRFAWGGRYEDHAPGDRTAAYGIAGLVAGVIGLKAVKAVGIGAMVLGLKKFFSFSCFHSSGSSTRSRTCSVGVATAKRDKISRLEIVVAA